MRISANSGWLWAALLFAVILLPSSGWAGTGYVIKNCPTEPAQNVPIVSGDVYNGTNCILSTASDRDTFQFKAVAGDTWSMVASAPTVAFPNNICMNLYTGSPLTLVTGACSDTHLNNPSIGFNLKLTVSGNYTILVYELDNAVISYGLALERLSPAPPDGIPVVLGQTLTAAISVPPALGVFTFPGTTTGTYQIAASMTTGANPLNLCFQVYQPDGTSALTGTACTDSHLNQLSVSANVTPLQNGTYVVVFFESFDDAAISYNFSVSCISAPGTCPTKPPPPPNCVLKDAASYSAASGTVTMNFTLGTPEAATWNAWLTDQNTMQSLWSASQPITEPQVTMTKTQTGVTKSGKVGILSTLTTLTGGITCSNFTLVNTGK